MGTPTVKDSYITSSVDTTPNCLIYRVNNSAHVLTIHPHVRISYVTKRTYQRTDSRL
jgi:hypothetical protein